MERTKAAMLIRELDYWFTRLTRMNTEKDRMSLEKATMHWQAAASDLFAALVGDSPTDSELDDMLRWRAVWVLS